MFIWKEGKTIAIQFFFSGIADACACTSQQLLLLEAAPAVRVPLLRNILQDCCSYKRDPPCLPRENRLAFTKSLW